MAINPTSFPMPQAFSGGVDFSPLANLGNVIRQGRQQAATEQTLAQLGPDPVANNQLLIRSQVPELVQAGLKGQNQQQERAENIREFNQRQVLAQAQDKRLQAAADRAQGDYDAAEKNEAEAKAMLSDFFKQPASSFPAPATASQGLPVPPTAPQQGLPTPAAPGLPEGQIPGLTGGLTGALSGLGAPRTPAGSTDLSPEQLNLLAQNPVTRKFALAQAAAQQENALQAQKMSPEYAKAHAQAVAEGQANAPQVMGLGSAVVRPATAATEGPLYVNRPQTTMDSETRDLLAKRVLAGDTKALVGLGRGAQGAENLMEVQKRVAELAAETGVDASGILRNIASQAANVSEARKVGTLAGGFGVAEKAMEESLPVMLEASNNVPRTSFPGLNRLILEGRTQVGDPNVAKLLVAVDTAAKDYARITNPAGFPRIEDLKYARQVLAGSDSPEVLLAKAQQLYKEAGVTRRAIDRQREELRTGKPTPAPAGITPVPGTAPKIDPALEAEMRKRGIHPGG
jgi:hypothetical protein